MYDLWRYIAQVYMVVLVLSLLSGFIFYKKLTVLSKYLLAYAGVLLLCQLVSDYVGVVFKNNHIMLPIYCMAELSFFIVFFRRVLFKKTSWLPLLMGGTAMAYILGEFYYNFIDHYVDPKDFQPYCKVVANFCVLLYCLMFLYQKMKYNHTRTEKFPLTIGLLIYFTLNSLFFLPFNFLINENSAFTLYFWMVNISMLAVYAGFIGFFIVSPLLLKAPAALPTGKE